MNAMPPAAAPNRSWIQWSLRSFLILTVMLGVAFGWWGAKLRKESRINEAVRLIAASPGWWPSDDYNPIAVVRAVNALYALGKGDAIIALRRFAKEYPSTGAPDVRHEALRLIIPLLFERPDPEDRFPDGSHLYSPERYQLGVTEWLFFRDIRVMDDIPFNCHPGGGFSGGMDDFSYAIDWAEKSGRFRVTPMMPVDDPLAAADREMIDLARISGGSEKAAHLARSIREQALDAVAHLLPAEDKGKYRYSDNRNGSELDESFRHLADNEHWAALKELCEPLKIRWSPQQQAYVAGRGD